MRRVLAINAPDDLRQALGTELARPESTVDHAGGSVQALQALRQRSYDVVITDPATGIGEDLALAQEIEHFRPGVRLVVLASRANPEALLDALRKRVFACFTSPLDVPEIVDMTRKALEEEAGAGLELVSGLPHWVTVRVSCRLTTAERLVRFMAELRSDLAEDDRFLLLTAVRELVLNAMEHGAGFDADQVLEVTAARTSRAIVYHVRDPGRGFDRDALATIPHSSEPAEILRVAEMRAAQGLRPGGFGIFVARQIADELVYNERGNEVLLIKYTDTKEAGGTSTPQSEDAAAESR